MLEVAQQIICPVSLNGKNAMTAVLLLANATCGCRQDLQMRLLSLFVDFALHPMTGKQIWDLGALLPAIASLSHTLQMPHAVAQKKVSGHSFEALQLHQDDDPNRIKVCSLAPLKSMSAPAKMRKQH